VSRSYLRGLARRRAVPLVAVAALVGGVLVTSWVGGSAGAAPKRTHAKPVTAKVKGVKGAERTEYAQTLKKQRAAAGASQDARAGIPAKGPVAVLLQLDTLATTDSYRAALGAGKAAAKAAARTQLGRVRTAQRSVESGVRAVAPRSRVLYTTHSALAAVAVQTDPASVDALRRLPGVQAVYPIAAKHVSNAGAVPLQGGPAVWQALGDLGQDVTVGVIDSGIDYTHADFGGPGTTTAFDTNPRTTIDPSFFPTDKVIGGFDFAGDDYNADPGSVDPVYPYQPVPHPDPNPIDCRYSGPDSTVGHGTHVSGSLAGEGVAADGTTFTGPYGSGTPFDTMRIGPGMAPKASLYALRVFGCAGSSNVVGQALEWAMDPNGDGDPSDRLDVVNMSLGSDFGSPQDGDSVLSNAAALAGTVVVASIGNGGDVYDVGGSPGNAQRVLAAAASDDGFAVLDALRVNSPASIDGDYGAEQSVAFDWAGAGDTTGVLAAPPGALDPTDLSVNDKDGCDPFPAGTFTGKVAWLEWTDNDAVRRCGSVGRSANARAAGAIGAVFADDSETFSAGITGDAQIPVVMVIKSAGDTIRPHLAESVSVTLSTVGNVLHNTIRQNLPQLADTLASFSSRGTHGNGNVKPDVAAVGAAVFSVDAGSGNQGKTLSGTSMASPMTAGLAALVRSRHPDWTPEEVKADIMNTAGQDVTTEPNHGGDRYAPNRVGAGRIQAPQALANQVLAYVLDDKGAVSVSFGPVAVTQATQLSKTVRVVNKGVTGATYALAYQPVTAVPGVSYVLSTDTVSLAPREAKTFTVTLKVDDPTALTKTVDPTVVSVAQGDVERQFLADASGRVVLSSTGRPSLRVPVYSAPRPASAMTTPAELHLPAGGFSTGDLPLLGHGVDQGDDPAHVISVVSGYALEATSGRLPACTASVVEHCIGVPDDRGVDLKYVGVTTNGPAVQAGGGDPIADPDAFTFFGVSAWGTARTPTGLTGYTVYIDADRNGVPDEALIATRFVDTDIMVTVLVDLASGEFLADSDGNNAWFLNGLPGAVDTDIFDSDSLSLPVATEAIAATSLDPAHPRIRLGHSRINYGVAASSAYHNQPLDLVGLTAAGKPTLTVDVVRPALTVGDGVSADEYLADLPGLPLSVRKDVPAFGFDKPLGLLILHHHNTDGVRAQVVRVKQPSAPRLALSTTHALVGHPVLAVVRIPASAGPLPTGTVTLRYGSAGVVLARARTNNGYFAVNLRLRHGVYVLYADYSGDNYYLPHRSNLMVLQVS